MTAKPADPTPEQTDLAAVRAQIAETDAELQSLAADLPSVELRLVLGKQPKKGTRLSWSATSSSSPRWRRCAAPRRQR